jgi:Tol biopolymer transport system component
LRRHHQRDPSWFQDEQGGKRDEADYYRPAYRVGRGLDGSIRSRIPGDSSSWLPDGRLALSLYNGLFATDASLAHSAQIGADLPDAASDIAVSPDGRVAAFAMDGHVWTENLADGSNLKQLTASSGAEGQPAWSPDGRYVAVEYYGYCPIVYAVPADGQRVFIGNPAVPTSALMLQKIEDGHARDICAFSDLSWRL